MRKTCKKVLSLLLTLVLCLGLVPGSAFATEKYRNSVQQFSGGDGTANNPYQISTAEQFDNIRNDLSASYVLQNDISFTNFASWTPIETFSGALDGQGHIITGFSINNSFEFDTSKTYCGLGLFGTVSNGGVIKNLELKDVNITTDSGKLGCCGALVGKLFNGTIKNCQVSGKMVKLGNGGYTGGLVGYADHESATIIDCHNYCDITVTGQLEKEWRIYAGGIVGYSLSSNKIEHCYNSGNVEVQIDWVLSGTSATVVQSGVGGITGLGRAKNSCNVATSLQLKNSSGVALYERYCNRISGGYESTNCVSLRTTKVDGSVISSGTLNNSDGQDMDTIQDVDSWYNNITKPDQPTPPIPEDVSILVYFLSGWDAVTRTVKFGDEEITPDTYTVADNVDVSNISSLLNKYVLVTMEQGDSSLEYTITDIKPVESKIGTVSATGEHSLTIDGTTYPVREDFYLTSHDGKEILYHVSNGIIMGFDVLEEKTGTLEAWDSTTGKVTIDGKVYSTNYMSDLSFQSDIDQHLGKKITFFTSGNSNYTPLIRIDKFIEPESEIAVFSTEKSLTVKTGESMWLGFGKILDGQIVGDWKRMGIVVSDPTVISLSEYEETEYGYSLKVTGKKQGAANVTITDTEGGQSTVIVISVRDSYVGTYSYAIDNMETFYPNNQWENKIQTNIYDLNGLYVNNYTCSKVGNIYTVSFDVYNSRYHTGAVDIYDANGNWINCEEIKKYSIISSLWDTGEQAFYLISDLHDGRLLTYEQASSSKKSHVSFEVPADGYFTISNNFAESPGTFLFNSCDILYEGVFTLINAGVDLSKVEPSAFSGMIKEKVTENKTVRETFIGIFKKTVEKEVRSYGKRIMNGEIDGAYSDISGQLENLLSSLDISWKHLFKTATGVGESVFTKLAGPAGTALDGCFAFTKGSNQLVQAIHLARSVDAPYATVFSSIDKDTINSHGVIVNTNGNVDTQAELHVFRVSNNDTIEVVLDGDKDGHLKKYELYNICFVKNDQLVQPSGKVSVRIPIPNGMKKDTCNVYRQESDGTWTILTAHIEGNYLVFETDHFSLYGVVGKTSHLSIISLPNKTQYNVGDILDSNGLALSVDGESITTGFICDPMVLSQKGEQNIIVQYGLSSTMITVSVRAASYTITFDAGNGTVTPNSVTTGEAGKLTTLPVPTRSGYTFDGWFTAASGGEKISTDYIFTADTTVYAHWTKDSGGSSGGSSSGSSSSGGGSSGGSSTYPPTVSKPSEGGGAAIVSPSNPKQGDTVTVTPTPDEGYEVDKITVTGPDGKPVEVKRNPDGTYTFIQPNGKVKIEVTYKPIEGSWSNPFTDVFEGDWYYAAVRFVQENGLMNGYGEGRFGPNDNLSRAQFAQILFNREGRPVVNYLMQFGDVTSEAWYAEAVRWAASQGIVSGYGNGMFGPNDPVTREQLAVMLWRHYGSPAATNKELHFNDANEISGFALEAMRWAVEHGIVNGYGDGRLGPKGQATRAQVAQMLKNFLEK